uniref:Membrane protein n=1 Tax=Guangdong chinese water skink coronavirus TaxID=2116470 RepID=A0A2P1GNI6_9NIDO|nr:matrix protein [Guangdong chinese water skink coronavirus]
MSNSTDGVVLSMMNSFNNWTIFLGVFLLFFGLLLQYGYLHRSFVLYLFKLLLLLLIWPITMTLCVWNFVFQTTSAALGFNICLFVLALFMLIWYLFQSIRLFLRTYSFWSFNPESYGLFNFKYGKGHHKFMPCDGPRPYFCLIMRDYSIFVDGYKLVRVGDFDQMPQYCRVHVPGTTFMYKKIRGVKLGDGYGVVLYEKNSYVQKRELDKPSSLLID